MNDVLFDALLKIKKHPDSSYVFCNKDEKPYGSIKTAFRYALKRAEIRNFRFHDLRHTFASHPVRDIKVTLRYAHLSSDHKRRAVETLCNKLEL